MALKEEKQVQVITDENKHKVISVIGIGGNDIMYFLVKAAISASKKMLYVDNTEDGAVFELNRKDDTDGCICMDNVSIVRNMAYEEAVYKAFDYVVINHGMQVDKEILEASNELFVITDYDRFHLAKIATVLKKAEIGKASVIFCDKQNEMITEGYICSYFGISSLQEYILEYAEANHAIYISLTHGKKALFSKYEKGFKEGALALYANVLDIAMKNAKRLLK